MKKLIVIIPIVLVTILLIKENKPVMHQSRNLSFKNTPYQVFFKALKIEKLTDTILLRSKTRVFGCGTDAIEYNNRLKETGLDKFYEKYGNILSNINLLEQFEKENNLKILWVNVGNEGGLKQLQSVKLHQNAILENRLFKEKCYIKFSEEPISLDSVNMYTLVLYPKIQTAIVKTYTIVKTEHSWVIDTITEEKKTGKDFEQIIFP